MTLAKDATQAGANIEVKVRCADLDAARAAALRIGAVPHANEAQVDTYFATRAGRLKLREIEGARAELIPYLRDDVAGARRSDYRVIPVSDGPGTRRLLSELLGVHRVVRKRREVLLWRNVRVHLDRVETLGSFLELEAVFDGSAESERAQHDACAQLLRELGLSHEPCIPGSYESLLAD
jgi:predicted adenylyl cyclase CyaB